MAARHCVGLVAMMAMTATGALAAPPEGTAISVTPIARDNQVVVSFELTDGLAPGVREAIQSGLPTTISYDVELRSASTWIDRTVAGVMVAATVRYDNLTRRYRLSRALDGHVEDARTTEDRDAVRRWLTQFDRVHLSTTSALDPSGEYYVRVRAYTRPRSSWFAWPWDHGAALGTARFTFIQ